MAKAVDINAYDLTPNKPANPNVTRQRGAVPSTELVPLQFKMPPEFVKAFKQEALNRGLKLNELLNVCFHEFMKKSDLPTDSDEK